ncbi:hypothetical protein AAHC35_03340 [Klebsiella quasipneumoniae subsp. similipneumoniae]|uniref:hypothetical protein n=1 Tax=Klebsiella TaxID=570 RepID=UPI000668B731|nr:hypothetical protein [Klebsiella quasipneumoniae]EKU6352411.1 hypothetical protein [Klebsiella quasipneumoniae]MCB3002024.1 hypothetical protein [Klebsiella quasipneumoniae]UAW27235.1 hypothetical protein J6325_13050 [Klebsiella quasipneumoniae]UDC05302.1 hypothetical protein LGM27_11550 [Klebsiella quasipneumoniae subsp. similipneumoniae]VGP06307.1 hypothetical protein SB00203_02820 [Klebsiella quasipneumoniae subsp. similipneumoniae]
MKILAFILLAIGTVALSYGNAPAKRIKDCENAGVGQAVCAAAEWDNEKVNVLPHYNPELNKVIIAGHLARIVYDPDNGASLRT